MEHDRELHVHLHLDKIEITVNHLLSADHALMLLLQSLKKDFSTMATNVQEAIDKLAADVTRLKTVDESAIALIQGFPALIAAAVAAAQAAGATPAQLAAFDDLSAGIEAKTEELATAVTAGTPAA